MSNRFLWRQKAEIAPVEEGQPSKTGIYLLCTRRLHGSSPLFPPQRRSRFKVQCSRFKVRFSASPHVFKVRCSMFTSRPIPTNPDYESGTRLQFLLPAQNF